MPGRLLFIAFTLFMPGVLIALSGCKAPQKNQESKAAFETVAKEKLGAKYAVSYNTLKTHVLCQQMREGDHSQRSFKYIVIKLSDNKIMYEGTFRMGYVRWLNDQSIEVLSTSVSKEDEKTSGKRIININSDQL